MFVPSIQTMWKQVSSDDFDENMYFLYTQNQQNSDNCSQTVTTHLYFSLIKNNQKYLVLTQNDCD